MNDQPKPDDEHEQRSGIRALAYIQERESSLRSELAKIQEAERIVRQHNLGPYRRYRNSRAESRKMAEKVIRAYDPEPVPISRVVDKDGWATVYTGHDPSVPAKDPFVGGGTATGWVPLSEVEKENFKLRARMTELEKQIADAVKERRSWPIVTVWPESGSGFSYGYDWPGIVNIQERSNGTVTWEDIQKRNENHRNRAIAKIVDQAVEEGWSGDRLNNTLSPFKR